MGFVRLVALSVFVAVVAIVVLQWEAITAVVANLTGRATANVKAIATSAQGIGPRIVANNNCDIAVREKYGTFTLGLNSNSASGFSYEYSVPNVSNIVTCNTDANGRSPQLGLRSRPPPPPEPIDPLKGLRKD